MKVQRNYCLKYDQKCKNSACMIVESSGYRYGNGFFLSFLSVTNMKKKAQSSNNVL